MPGGSSREPLTYRFGPFELDVNQGTLLRNGDRVRLQDLPYRLLVMLVERHGEVVTREEVRQRLWAENTFVEFDNSLGVAIRKVRESLGDDADKPLYVETIPRRGYRFLAPVTWVDPSKATELPAAVPVAGPIPVALPENPPHSNPSAPVEVLAPPASKPYWIFAVLALVLAGAVFYGYRFAGHASIPKTPEMNAVPPVRVRRSVAVLGFRNLPGRPEDNWLSPAFCEMLNTELAAGGELRMVSGEDVARAKSELPLTDEDSLAKSTLKRLRVDPGADMVVVGSYTSLPAKDGSHIRLDLRLQDTASGETVSEESVTGSAEDLFQLVAQASVGLRRSLGLSATSTVVTEANRAALPSNQRAMQFYTEGRARLWAFDFVAARDWLLKAVAADPEYPLAHSALAESLSHLGYLAKSRAEAQRAVELSQHLSEEERLLIEGQYRDTISDHSRATEAYQSLVRLFPDNLQYGLLLANAQRWINAADAVKTLDALRRLPAPAGDDPRIDLTESSAWIGHDLAKAHAAAERAIAKGTAQGSHLLVARAYGMLCEQGGGIGVSTAEAIASCENARQSYGAAGDRNNEARTLSDTAVIYFQQGDVARAEAIWRQAIPEFREVGDQEGIAAATNNLGDVFLVRGNLDDAKKFLEQAIPHYQAVEDKEGVALVLNDLGDLWRQKGQLQAALTSYRQAKATAEEIDSKNAIGYVLTGMGDTFLDQGDLAAARKAYEESLALRKEAGQMQYVGETRTALAHLSIEEGNAAEAEAAARLCKDQFHQEQQADDELTASGVRIEALLAQGKQADAQKEAESSQGLAAKNQNPLVRLHFDLAVARVMLESDHPESSQPVLERMAQETKAHDFVGLEFAVRLLQAELAQKTGRAAVAESERKSLEKAARSKGFGLIARKASAAHS